MWGLKNNSGSFFIFYYSKVSEQSELLISCSALAIVLVESFISFRVDNCLSLFIDKLTNSIIISKKAKYGIVTMIVDSRI